MKYKAVLFSTLMITLMVCLLPAPGACGMQSLDEAEMDDIYAEGFSEFTLDIDGSDNATMNLWLNINTAQYTEIETLKLGYHDQYEPKDPIPVFGWDHDWRNVEIGSGVAAANNFYTEGFYFRAEFADFSDPNLRQLKSVTYGVDYAKGTISADFVNFSGTINDGVGNEYNGHRLNLGPGTITADWDDAGPDTPTTPNPNPSKFELSLSLDNPYGGYWMTFTRATFTTP